MTETPNIEKTLAFDFLQTTDCNIFLTGKAGTGKTTFLKQLKEQVDKRIVVTAPTGVAAMNAHGVTLHSLFQLPFTPYIPGRNLLKDNRFSKAKINLIRSIDLLVIDEISMVRSDVLDAVSSILKRYRRNSQPFGGVQLLMIGDLQQLAPVVKDDEWTILSAYYKTPFFFDSLELAQTPYYPIELKHIYRQQDARFINLLNAIRENRIDSTLLSRLNSRYLPQFTPDPKDGYVTLTTHNRQSLAINSQQMDLLHEKIYTYDAIIEKDFPEYLYPTDFTLNLKVGAQVMFIQNDSSSERRYYNGKIGWIHELSTSGIKVRCGEEIIELERGKWQNIKYSIDEQTQDIVEEVEGLFKQYPLKLAYAITIHKSQGLTFDKVVIDAALAFSHGQIYVALSRCRTLEGIVLSSRIPSSAFIQDNRIDQYIQSIESFSPSQLHLADAQRKSYYQLLNELFNLQSLITPVSQIAMTFNNSLSASYPQLTTLWKNAITKLRALNDDVAFRFRQQLQHLVMNAQDYKNDSFLKERLSKGASYFLNQIQVALLPPISTSLPDIDNKEVKKHLTSAWVEAQQIMDCKLALMELVTKEFTISEYFRIRSKMLAEKPTKEVIGKTTSVKVSVSEIKNPKLYNALKDWRNQEAQELGLPPYTILQQKALIGIANEVPTTKKELLSVTGVGKRIIEKYGVTLLEIVDKFRMFPEE